MNRVAPLTLLTLAVVSACAPTTPKGVRPPLVKIPAIEASGLERVMGRDARSLVALFGPADQDVREPGARKLQFSGPICILDAYLYAIPVGKEPTVSYIDARQPSGQAIDRASCIAALTRRKEAR